MSDKTTAEQPKADEPTQLDRIEALLRQILEAVTRAGGSAGGLGH